MIKPVMRYGSPMIALYADVFTEAECEYLISISEDKLTASTVVDAESGESRDDIARVSKGCFFKTEENQIVSYFDSVLSRLACLPVKHGEGMQIVRYDVGGEYKAHYDWFDPSHPGSIRHLEKGGQRIITAIVYLSDVAGGGETYFPALEGAEMSIVPARGNVLLFSNVDAKGMPSARMLHGGAPVSEGVKYIATKWFRERPYL